MASEYSGTPPDIGDQHCVEDSRRRFVMVYNDHLDRWADKSNGLKPSALAVYLCLLRHAGNTSRQCFPSLDTIASETCQSRTTVVSALKALQRNDLVSIRKEPVPGGYERSVYTILDPAPSGQSNFWTEADKNYDARSKKDGRQGSKSGLELDVEELEPNGSDHKKTKRREPSGPEQHIVAAFCDAVGIENPVGFSVMIGQAKTLHKAGLTPDDVREVVDWLLSDSFWASKGIDLGTVVKQANKWRAAQRQASRPKVRRHVV